MKIIGRYLSACQLPAYNGRSLIGGVRPTSKRIGRSEGDWSTAIYIPYQVAITNYLGTVTTEYVCTYIRSTCSYRSAPVVCMASNVASPLACQAPSKAGKVQRHLHPYPYRLPVRSRRTYYASPKKEREKGLASKCLHWQWHEYFVPGVGMDVSVVGFALHQMRL